MEKIEQLGQILQTEADLVEALAGVMVQKQQSIVRFDAGSLGTLTQREQDLLVPFQALEGERMKLAEELAGQPDSFSKDASGLLKFHGVYQGDDRDLRKAGAGKVYSAMVRVGKARTAVGSAGRGSFRFLISLMAAVILEGRGVAEEVRRETFERLTRRERGETGGMPPIKISVIAQHRIVDRLRER